MWKYLWVSLASQIRIWRLDSQQKYFSVPCYAKGTFWHGSILPLCYKNMSSMIHHYPKLKPIVRLTITEVCRIYLKMVEHWVGFSNWNHLTLRHDFVKLRFWWKSRMLRFWQWTIWFGSYCSYSMVLMEIKNVKPWYTNITPYKNLN